MPYREADLPPPTAEHAREIVYRPRVRDGHMNAMRSYVRYFLFVLPVAVLLVIAHWGLALAFVTAVIARDIRKARRERAAGIRIGIEGANLVVEPDGLAASFVEIPMAKLLDVSLDTRTVNRAGREVRPDGMLASGAAFPVDESRIVLVIAGRDPVHLTEAYFSQSDSLEWLGKIRMYLRKRGWVPEDERSDS